jgi:hypothetical protein
MGTVIMRSIFTRTGKGYLPGVLADSIPSMKPQKRAASLQISKKGLSSAVNIVMPGTGKYGLRKGGKVIFRGSYKFDV